MRRIALHCNVFGCGALGKNRTCDTRFRKPVLYPLSYEGLIFQTTWSSGLFPLLVQVNNVPRFGLGPHLGRTVPSIHRISEVLEVVFIEV